jgi:hypothetical protein
MHQSTSDLHDLPRLPDEWIRRRRSHLITEIRTAADDTRSARLVSRPRWRRPKVIAFAAVTAALITTAAAAAVTQFDLFEGPAAPARTSARVPIESGEGWTLVAWRSSEGPCLAFQLPNAAGAEGCGFPVAGSGSKEETTPIAGLVFQSAELDRGFAAGVISPKVAQVEARLRNGTTSAAQIYSAPPELQTSARLFFTRYANDDQPVSFTAIGPGGDVLGSWTVAPTSKRVVRVHP